MTAAITAPTDPTELLAPVPGAPAPGRGPAGNFDLLMALLVQAQDAPLPDALASQLEAAAPLLTAGARRVSLEAGQDDAITAGDGRPTHPDDEESLDLSGAATSGLAALMASALATRARDAAAAGAPPAGGPLADATIAALARDAERALVPSVTAAALDDAAPTGDALLPLTLAPEAAPLTDAEPRARLHGASPIDSLGDGGTNVEAVGDDVARRLAAISPRVTRVAAGAEVIPDRNGHEPREGDGVKETASDNRLIGTPSAVMASRSAEQAAESARSEPARDPIDQIALRLRDVKGPGLHEISLRLDPPDLGAVRIDARLEGTRLHLQIRAEHAPTGELLADALPRLREALSQQGFVSSTVSVHLGFDASGRQFTPDNAPTFAPRPDGVAAPPPAVVAAPTPRAVLAGDGLDVWA